MPFAAHHALLFAVLAGGLLVVALAGLVLCRRGAAGRRQERLLRDELGGDDSLPQAAQMKPTRHDAPYGMLLGDILVKKQRVIGPNDLAGALVRQHNANQRLGRILIDMGLISKEQLQAALEEQGNPTDPWADV